MPTALKAVLALRRRYESAIKALDREIAASRKKGKGKGVKGGARARAQAKKRLSFTQREELNRLLEDKLGPSPRHQDWASLAEQYPDKFEDQLRDIEEQEEFEDEDDE